MIEGKTRMDALIAAAIGSLPQASTNGGRALEDRAFVRSVNWKESLLEWTLRNLI